jgi:hypothetical protein
LSKCLVCKTTCERIFCSKVCAGRGNAIQKAITVSRLEILPQELFEQTAFLDSQDPSPTQRIWHFEKGIFEIQTCSCCGNPTTWKATKRAYTQFCSKVCAGKGTSTRRVISRKGSSLTEEDLINQTSFLPSDAAPAQRLWHLQNNIPAVPLCICGSPCLWRQRLVRYTETCSLVCAGKLRYSSRSESLQSENNKIKAVAGRMRNFGVQWPSQSSLVQKIRLEKRLEKVGETPESLKAKTAFLAETAPISQRLWHIQNQIRDVPKCLVCNKDPRSWHSSSKSYNLYCSWVCRYQRTFAFGLPTILKMDPKQLKDKIVATNLLKRGVPHPMNSPEVVRTRRINNQAKYGKDTYNQVNPAVRCHLIDPVWLQDQHHNQKKTLQRIASELEINTQTVCDYFKKAEVPILRLCGSQAERDLGEWLGSLGLKIQTGRRDLLGNGKELDIFIPSHNLALEYGGLFWHSDFCQEDKNYHLDKLNRCRAIGIQLITLFEDEWVHKQAQVKAKLLSLLGKDDRPKVSARKCQIQRVAWKVKTAFLETNHIQGNGPSSLTLGLYHQENLVAVLDMLRRGQDWILNRYSTSCRVQGGLSKLLATFRKSHPDALIISFADQRWSTGNLYEATGWKKVQTLYPGYFYVDLKELKRLHRSGFRHSRLRGNLPGYDADKTEVENTRAAGIPRIWDCGLIKYQIGG